jgi:tRNA1(Val) A37 N6-methylase TrmN6
VLSKYSFSTKKLQFVYTGDENAKMVLIKAIKNGNSGSLVVPKGINISNLSTYKGIFMG